MLLEMNVKLRRGHFDMAAQLSLEGRSAGLFGKSGAGKSTVLGLIAGTIEPRSGHIILDGQTLFDSRKGIVTPAEQRPVGAVLQSGFNDIGVTVRDRLESVKQHLFSRRRLFKMDFLIGLLELEAMLDRPLEFLSAGERQRVALACSLLKSPRLLLLDETFAGVGDACRMQLLPILKRLQQEFNLGILYASQSLAEIIELTDQLVVLDQGRVLHSGSLQKIAKQQDILR
ncbi:MAG: ATP-binding cassette domain-containing protein, partial [Methylomonas sp.]|nr:ATP-binding cassette domain-containing protein [Methylomonas sp.]